MYKAITIKEWIVKKISLKGWWSLMVRALPMLLNENADFPVLGVDKKTLWTLKEVEIIQFHLQKAFNEEMPANLLDQAYHDRGGLSDKIKTTISDINTLAIKFGKSILPFFFS